MPTRPSIVINGGLRFNNDMVIMIGRRSYAQRKLSQHVSQCCLQVALKKQNVSQWTLAPLGESWGHLRASYTI